MTLQSMLYGDIFYPVYEGEGDEGAAGNDESPDEGSEQGESAPNVESAEDHQNGKKTFTQEELNKLLAKERRKEQSRTEKALKELEAIRSRAELTAQERDELDNRITQMRDELLSKEELAKKKQERLQKEHEQRLNTLSAERDTWKTRYESSTIKRAITDAAAGENAYSPSQIVAILGSNTRLVEVLDSDGNPTGELEPKVKFSDKDKEGKPLTLDVTPAEAVKRMKEMDEYLNLFKVEGAGGAGLQNRGSSRKPDPRELAKDPAAYRKARQEGLVKFQ